MMIRLLSSLRCCLCWLFSKTLFLGKNPAFIQLFPLNTFSWLIFFSVFISGFLLLFWMCITATVSGFLLKRSWRWLYQRKLKRSGTMNPHFYLHTRFGLVLCGMACIWTKMESWFVLRCLDAGHGLCFLGWRSTSLFLVARYALVGILLCFFLPSSKLVPVTCFLIS